MKNIIGFCLILFPFILVSQINIERSVFSSLGQSASGVVHVDATIGESAIGMKSNHDIKITIGFQQSFDIINTISDQETGNFTLYPNPAFNLVNLVSENKIESVKMIDITGKTVFCQTAIDEFKPMINVSNLSSGTYILQIKTQFITIHEQLVIH